MGKRTLFCEGGGGAGGHNLRVSTPPHTTVLPAPPPPPQPDIWTLGCFMMQLLTEGLRGDRPSQRALAATSKDINRFIMGSGLLSAADISAVSGGSNNGRVREKQRLLSGVPWKCYQGGQKGLRTLHACPLYAADTGVFVNVSSELAARLEHLTVLDIEIIHYIDETEAIPSICPLLQHLRMKFRHNQRYDGNAVTLAPLRGLKDLRSLSVTVPWAVNVMGVLPLLADRRVAVDVTRVL